MVVICEITKSNEMLVENFRYFHIYHSDPGNFCRVATKAYALTDAVRSKNF